MDFENNEISKFLDQFEKENSEVERAFASGRMAGPAEGASKAASRHAPAEESFKKLEEKINELERKFEVSVTEKQALEKELKSTKEDVEKQKSKEEFFNNIASTIANLKESVDRMSAVRPTPRNEVYGPGYYYGAPINQASVYGGADAAYLQAAASLDRQNKIIEEQALELKQKEKEIFKRDEQALTQTQELASARVQVKQSEMERMEQEKAITSLKEKTSRLKAVNLALDTEFKRVQEEKVEALRKSAEQAKEILLLREQLNAAEERFKSFDFEGRIISIKKHYEERVAGLETQLQEMSAVCMKQVEEIESLKTENLALKALEESRTALQKEYEDKTLEISALKAEIEKISSVKELNVTDEKSRRLEVETRLDQAKAAANAEINKIRTAYAAQDAARSKDASKRIADIAAQAQQNEAALNTRMAALQAEKDALEKQLSASPASSTAVQQEREKFERLFKDLGEKIKTNDKVIEELKTKIAVLSDENAGLKAAPKQDASITPDVMSAIITASPAPKVKAAAPEPKEFKVEPKAENQAPKEIVKEEPVRTATAAASARANAKAERKAAAPEEERDFLADTQSFVGRLRWSLLKDD